MQKSPLAKVKERFGDKAALIKAIEALATDDLWLERVNADKGLACVSNAKLLHLHDVLSRVKSEFGTRDKLIDAVTEAEKRSADADYKKALAAYPTPRLMDQLQVAKRRSSAA